MAESEYLKSRGWVPGRIVDGSAGWFDPLYFGAPYTPMTNCRSLTEEWALIIQRARDAEREAAAWVQFAAPLAGGKLPPEAADVPDLEAMVARLAGKLADAFLVEYRKRFALSGEG